MKHPLRGKIFNSFFLKSKHTRALILISSFNRYKAGMGKDREREREREKERNTYTIVSFAINSNNALL